MSEKKEIVSDGMNELEIDLWTLCKKHEIANASFCGNQHIGNGESKFVGILTADLTIKEVTPPLQMISILYVGRLWQFAREACRKTLTVFEGRWKSL